jgi:DNA (cytosine-5)-methyltransferase 1
VVSVLKVASLFSGIGGIDLGFQQAGFDVVWANEMDAAACRTYRYNFPNANLIEGDIKKISEDIIPDFEVLVAGFPCQPFSIAGLQKGFKDRDGNLFFEITRIIEKKRPKVVFLENVISLHIRNICRDLCNAAELYYQKHKDEFGFITYKISQIDPDAEHPWEYSKEVSW